MLRSCSFVLSVLALAALASVQANRQALLETELKDADVMTKSGKMIPVTQVAPPRCLVCLRLRRAGGCRESRERTRALPPSPFSSLTRTHIYAQNRQPLVLGVETDDVSLDVLSFPQLFKTGENVDEFPSPQSPQMNLKSPSKWQV
jgi:hypothetical protein